MLYRTRARRCAITAPMKYNTRPVAAAIPMAGGPTRPPRSPIAPATFRVPNIGSQERGTCTLAEFASTKPAGRFICSARQLMRKTRCSPPG